MKNKKYQIHKIVFKAILITVFFDIIGHIATSEAFFFIFISLLFLLYGLEKLGFFFSISERTKRMIMVLSKKIKYIIEKIKTVFLKKKKRKIKLEKKTKKNTKKKI
jgi:hypothetical protein